ncbi:MAG TPA: helix-turn-helix transcriptional regulator [Rhodanobacteraceae bacterium]|nr:helix-turn-helix transcriptional regulator [Rhodanobacteraceae bacterium]
MSALPALKDRLARVIRARRQALQLSQEAFADRLQMHRAFYGRVENGQNLTLQTLERVAEGLGVPAWELLREADHHKAD